ncbi:MAG: nuclear transport factor 2 family protein [Nitrospira sp.]|nr:nuclear transport factor 2 family protein [Nitrospira sp.]
MTMHSVVEQFKETYRRLDAQSLGLLAELYTDDVLFQDLFRRLEGLGALTDILPSSTPTLTPVRSPSTLKWCNRNKPCCCGRCR